MKNVKIVQFPHPGGEHKADLPGLKLWNTSAHLRKFLQVTGDYIDENNQKQINQKICFWGEWEPPGFVEKIEKVENDLCPKYLHRPFLPNNIMDIKLTKTLQNTDPYVFDKNFRYFVCKQVKSDKETALARLERGSLILFGSTRGNKRDTAFFQLDTVFVVDDYVEYSTDQDINDDRIPEIYKKIVYNLCFPNKITKGCNGKENAKPLKMRIYSGANYDKPFEGMYSFTPAKVYNPENPGFPRLKLKDLDYMTNNLNASAKSTQVDSICQVQDFWKKIRENCKQQGYVEGVRLECLLEDVNTDKLFIKTQTKKEELS